PPTPALFTLSLHDALPIFSSEFAHRIEQLTSESGMNTLSREMIRKYCLLVTNHSMKDYSLLIRKVLTQIDLDLTADLSLKVQARSEEHTSELQSRFDLVCR